WPLKQIIDEFFVCVRIGTFSECVGLFNRGWQTGEIEKHTTSQRISICFWRWMKSMCQHFPQCELVDCVAWPLLPSIVDCRWFWSNRLDIRPMHGVMGALLDPFAQRGNLVVCKRFTKFGRRHPLIFIGTRDATNQSTGVRLPWNDRRRAR